MKVLSTEFGHLTVIFIVLKCVGCIDWSWWWVFSPTFIGILFSIVIWAIVEISRGC